MTDQPTTTCPTCGQTIPEPPPPTFLNHFDDGLLFLDALCRAYGRKDDISPSLSSTYHRLMAKIRPQCFFDQDWTPIHDWQARTPRDEQRKLAVALGF